MVWVPTAPRDRFTHNIRGAQYITLRRGIMLNLLIIALWANVVCFHMPCLFTLVKKSMPKKTEPPASFETALQELEQIVSRLESGELALEEALKAFEQGVQLARQGQQTLQQAEQRVQILLSDDDNAPLSPFTADAE